MEWKDIPIAKELVDRIDRIKGPLGYPSTAQFVGEAVRQFLHKQEMIYEEIQHEREVGREVLGKNPDKHPW